MATTYSEETLKILTDFVQKLSRDIQVDTELLAEVQRMVRDGELGNRSRISNVITILEENADDADN